MAKYVQVFECDDGGFNCSSSFDLVPLEVFANPLNAIDVGSQDFWLLVSASWALMATAWGVKRIVKFVAK